MFILKEIKEPGKLVRFTKSERDGKVILYLLLEDDVYFTEVYAEIDMLQLEVAHEVTVNAGYSLHYKNWATELEAIANFKIRKIDRDLYYVYIQ